jgi:hypothetical protein
MNTELHPDPAFRHASPTFGQLVDEEEPPPRLSKLLRGLRGGIKDAVVDDLYPESVLSEIQNNADRGALPQAGELVAVGDQLGNHQGSVFHEVRWNPVA